MGVPSAASLRRTALDAVGAVHDQLLAAFRAPMDLDYKRDVHDVVTVHDRAAEVTIAKVLQSAVPDSVVVGEEGGVRGTGRVQWFVDPIDGTANFARGLAYWCVSIGAAVDGEVVAGVVHDPVAGTTFSADDTGFLVDGDPGASRAATRLEHSTALTTYPSAIDLTLDGDRALSEHGWLLRRFGAIRNLGSGALQLAHVAAGWADVSYGFWTNTWDVAAGSLLVRRSGGTYRGWAAGEELAASAAFTGPDYLAVGAGVEHPELAELVARVSGARGARP